MKGPSATRRLARAVMLAAMLCLPVSASANDYYSWIDANGTMVMTDDPSRVPPPTDRSQIQVHRFAPASSGKAGRAEAEPVPREEPPPVARPEAVDPRDLNLPLVVLGGPDKNVGPQYVWVPLVSPLFVGGNMVNGFWWYPGATSPVEAFKQFLARHNRQQQSPQRMPGAGVTYPYPYPYPSMRSPSGNTVYDQVVRERQALEESIRLRHFPNAPAPGRPNLNGPTGGGGRHSIRAR